MSLYANRTPSFDDLFRFHVSAAVRYRRIAHSHRTPLFSQQDYHNDRLQKIKSKDVLSTTRVPDNKLSFDINNHSVNKTH